MQESGRVIDLQLPKAGRGPQLPYPMPEGRRTILLDITVNSVIEDVWKAMLASSSDALVDFHEQNGDKDMKLGGWREQEDGSRTRFLKFVTPLKNPLGPKQAVNREHFTVVDMKSNGFTLEARCTSEGVPFSSSFENRVQWMAMSMPGQKTRIIISGECNFTGSVFGPFRGTISRESIKVSVCVCVHANANACRTE